MKSIATLRWTREIVSIDPDPISTGIITEFSKASESYRALSSCRKSLFPASDLRLSSSSAFQLHKVNV